MVDLGSNITELETTMQIRTKLPFMRFENETIGQYLLAVQDPHRLVPVLQQGSFTVLSVNAGKPTGSSTAAGGLPWQGVAEYDLVMPHDWTLISGFDQEGNESERVQDICDEKGRLRGEIQYNNDGKQYSGTIFCRYALLDIPQIYQLPVPQRTALEYDWLVVGDRLTVSREHRMRFDTIVHEAYPLRRTVRKGQTMQSRRAFFEKSMAIAEAGQIPYHHPIYEWLETNLPSWQNPWAYWDD